MESFAFVFCLNFQVNKRKKLNTENRFCSKFALFFKSLNAKSVILRSQKLRPQAEWWLNIVWKPGVRGRRRARHTQGTNIKTIFIKIQAARWPRGENAHTKLCHSLRAPSTPSPNSAQPRPAMPAAARRDPLHSLIAQHNPLLLGLPKKFLWSPVFERALII